MTRRNLISPDLAGLQAGVKPGQHQKCLGSRSRLFAKSTEGSEIVEFGLVIIPLLAFVFLIMDVAWVLFAQSTLQHSAREGVRYAVTGQTGSGIGQDASIRSIVIQNSFGFVTNATASNIQISYYDPTTLAPTPRNNGGNVVEIIISGVNVYPLGPIWRSGAAMTLTARSSDVMEGSPGGMPPPR